MTRACVGGSPEAPKAISVVARGGASITIGRCASNIVIDVDESSTVKINGVVHKGRKI